MLSDVPVIVQDGGTNGGAGGKIGGTEVGMAIGIGMSTGNPPIAGVLVNKVGVEDTGVIVMMAAVDVVSFTAIACSASVTAWFASDMV